MLLLYMHALFIKVHPAEHANIRLAWKRDEHSSLFCATVGDEEKAVDAVDTFLKFHKTFFGVICATNGTLPYVLTQVMPLGV